MTFFAKAIASGFSAITVLDYLKKNYPQYAPLIDQAERMGFRPQTIMQKLDKPKATPHDDEAYMTDFERAQKYQKQNRREAVSDMAATGAGLATLGTAIANPALAAQMGGLGGIMGKKSPPSSPAPPGAGSQPSEDIKQAAMDRLRKSYQETARPKNMREQYKQNPFATEEQSKKIREEEEKKDKKKTVLSKEKERFEKEYGTQSSEDAAFIEEIKKLLEM